VLGHADSDIFHLDLAGTPLIVLSSLETTEALLDKRSVLYSDRFVYPTAFPSKRL
jgi:hypothetical protein